jgi:hypothetical protein
LGCHNADGRHELPVGSDSKLVLVWAFVLVSGGHAFHEGRASPMLPTVMKPNQARLRTLLDNPSQTHASPAALNLLSCSDSLRSHLVLPATSACHGYPIDTQALSLIKILLKDYSRVIALCGVSLSWQTGGTPRHSDRGVTLSLSLVLCQRHCISSKPASSTDTRTRECETDRETFVTVPTRSPGSRLLPVLKHTPQRLFQNSIITFGSHTRAHQWFRYGSWE